MPVVPPGTPTAPGLYQSGNDFIKQALRMNNILASGTEPDANDLSDSMIVLNQMMDAWNAENLMIYTTRIDDFPLVVGQQTYTLGSGGNFNIQRPASIERTSIMLLNNPSFPLEVTIPRYTTQDWQENVPLKLVPSTFPLLVYDDGAFPYRNLNFWPIPQVINNFRLYSWNPLSTFADSATKYAFPPGYAEAIAFSLAARIAVNFGKPIDPAIAIGAEQALLRIKSVNVPDDVLRCDDAVSSKQGAIGSHNYRTELFGIP